MGSCDKFIIFSGDLLVWDITKAGRDKSKLFHPSGQGHQRFVFNFCSMGADGEVLVTTSMDRQVGTYIMKTCPCNEYPLTPNFYIVKLGFIGVYIIFVVLLQNIDCGYSLEPPH